MSIYLGSSNRPSVLFEGDEETSILSKEMKSPQIHLLSILISQRRWRDLNSTILIPPRSSRALKSTTSPFKTIQSAWVYVPSNTPHVHLSSVFKPTISPFLSLKGDGETSNPPFWSLKGDKEPLNSPFPYLQGAVEPSNPPPYVHLKLFKVLGSMYLQTHHMSIYLGPSNLPSLLCDPSKEMKSPQIHHLYILISQRIWRTLKSTILIPQRSSRALKFTTIPSKTIQSAWIYVLSNPPHVHLSWVFKPTILPFWSLKGHEDPSNPPSVHFDLSKGDEEPSIPPFWCLEGALEPSNPPLVY